MRSARPMRWPARIRTGSRSTVRSDCDFPSHPSYSQRRPARMSRRRRSLLTLLLFGGLVPPRASRATEPYDLRVIVGDDSETQRQIILALRRRYPSMVSDANVAKFGHAGRAVVYLAV